MTTAFPTALDTFSNPSAGVSTNNLTTPHAAQHANVNDAIEAIEAKLGIGASTPTAGTILRGTGVGSSGFLAKGTLYQLLRMNAGATDMEWATTPKCLVYNDANQSIANSTQTALTFNQERFDSTGSMHSTSSNTSRIIAPEAGVYLAWAVVAFASNATGVRNVQVLINGGSTNICQILLSPVNGDVTIFACGGFWDLAANDYVEVKVTQTSGGSLNVQAVNGLPSFALVKVA